MLIQSPLGAQIANLKTVTTARQTRARLPDVLHILIAAILARIFDRLEQIIALWQSGNLPAPSPRRPNPSAPAAAPCPPSPRTQGHPARQGPRTRARTPIPAPTAIIRRTTPTPTIPSAAKDRRCLRPPRRRRIRPARAPPPPLPAGLSPKTTFARSHKHIIIVTIS